VNEESAVRVEECGDQRFECRLMCVCHFSVENHCGKSLWKITVENLC